ncbi:MAG: NYN domain-containing protein [Bacteroidota bacterium]|nr:NYN domain-containing protein [Bacteroidota bacterium]
MALAENTLTRIGVFYDGNYFLHVSNYYNYVNDRKRRISITGLHEFIKYRVAELEKIEPRLTQVVDAHYFRGRLNAAEANQRPNQLYFERVFDDILMSAGVTTHYLPVKTKFGGKREEKGIDVWLALEAYELSRYKDFDVVVLITSDGDYVPLVRKLNTLGIRVMLLSWDFAYTDDFNKTVETRTSQDLLEIATYPISMYDELENRANRTNTLIQNLFVAEKAQKDKQEAPLVRKPATGFVNDSLEGDDFVSIISNLKSGFGFIEWNPKNLFFHYSSLVDMDFNDLREGDQIEFNLGKNDRGDDMAINIRWPIGGDQHNEVVDYVPGIDDQPNEY